MCLFALRPDAHPIRSPHELSFHLPNQAHLFTALTRPLFVTIEHTRSHALIMIFGDVLISKCFFLCSEYVLHSDPRTVHVCVCFQRALCKFSPRCLFLSAIFKLGHVLLLHISSSPPPSYLLFSYTTAVILL